MKRTTTTIFTCIAVLAFAGCGVAPNETNERQATAKKGKKPKPCREKECGPQPAQDAVTGSLCDDAGILSELVCQRDPDGKCGWTAQCSTPPNAQCTEAECGDPMEAPSILCEDGVSWAGPACQRGPDGNCGWVYVDCPSDQIGGCDDTECGEPPMAPSQQCENGSWAGPICQRTSNGECRWTITDCGCSPNNPCPDNLRCVAGECVISIVPCATDDDCGPGLHCINGVCEQSGGCTTDNDCPAGQRCIDDGICAIAEEPCISDGACPAGQQCINNRCLVAEEPCSEAGGPNPCLPWQQCNPDGRCSDLPD